MVCQFIVSAIQVKVTDFASYYITDNILPFPGDCKDLNMQVAKTRKKGPVCFLIN